MEQLNITSPTLLLDEHKCRNNLKSMIAKVKRSGLSIRPHFKTHQSVVVASWLRQAGVDKCTVSSLKMAKYFAGHGWDDILIAFPVNVREHKAIDELALKIDLSVLVYNDEALKLLTEKVTAPLGVKIELDLGSHRSGLEVYGSQAINKLLKSIEAAPSLRFTGFYSHPGHTYAARGREAVLKIYENVMAQLTALKNEYKGTPGFSVTIGDTPGTTLARDFGPVDTISPGNFVFYDVMQVNIGSCSYDDIAVVVACPVVGKNAITKELLIHGGAVHFSKESLTDADGTVHFGKLAFPDKTGWHGHIPGVYLKSISQEHGLIQCTPEFFENARIGDIVYVYPAHSCLAADLFKSYLLTDGTLLDDNRGFMK